MNPLVLNNISYGMYAIGVKDKKRPSACICNSVAQISKGNTCCVAVNVNNSNYSCDCIKENGIFTISVLSEETPGTIIGALGLVSGKRTNKLKNVRHKVLVEGVPVIKENTCCWFLCEVMNTVEAEEQTIFIAKIIAGSDTSVGKPMTYNYYRDILGGSAPVDSPVYFPSDNYFDTRTGERFICSVCGYEYSDPNFPFEELPDTWTCPVCKMSKKAYIRKK